MIALTNSAAEGCRMRSRKSCKPKKTSAFSILRRLVETGKTEDAIQHEDYYLIFTQNPNILFNTSSS